MRNNNSIIVAFHPDLSLPRINLFRSYDQSYSLLMSLAHLLVFAFNYFDDSEIFNKNTLKQLEAAASSVKQKEKNTALTDMFSVELKFTIDCLKSWFQKNPVKKDILCCLCDFPIDPKINNGWLDHVIKAEYLFLENIYSDEEMKKMKIETVELFEKK